MVSTLDSRKPPGARPPRSHNRKYPKVFGKWSVAWPGPNGRSAGDASPCAVVAPTEAKHQDKAWEPGGSYTQESGVPVPRGAEEGDLRNQDKTHGPTKTQLPEHGSAKPTDSGSAATRHTHIDIDVHGQTELIGQAICRRRRPKGDYKQAKTPGIGPIWPKGHTQVVRTAELETHNFHHQKSELQSTWPTGPRNASRHTHKPVLRRARIRHAATTVAHTASE